MSPRDFRISALEDPLIVEELLCLMSARESKTWTQLPASFDRCLGASETCDAYGFRFPFSGTLDHYCASPILTCPLREHGWRRSPSVQMRVLEPDDILGFRQSTQECVDFVYQVMASALCEQDEFIRSAARAWMTEDWSSVDSSKPRRLSRVRNRMRARRELFGFIAKRAGRLANRENEAVQSQ